MATAHLLVSDYGDCNSSGHSPTMAVHLFFQSRYDLASSILLFRSNSQLNPTCPNFYHRIRHISRTRICVASCRHGYSAQNCGSMYHSLKSLLRLKEPAVLLRCRKEDLDMVDNILNSAKQEYAEKANVHAPEILVDKTVFLPPAPSHHNAHAAFCSGGVVLASRDGKIVFENTLDARLDVVFRKKLPEIRKLLFGQVVA